MVRYTDNRIATPIFSGKGSLSIKSYSPTKSDNYYLVFGYKCSDDDSINQRKPNGTNDYYYDNSEFDINVTYLDYDLSGFEEQCNHRECVFENVGPDEIVITENMGLEEATTSLRFPDGYDPIELSIYLSCLFGGVLIAVLIGLSFCDVYKDCFSKCKSLFKRSEGETAPPIINNKTEQETSEITPFFSSDSTTTPSSGETSTITPTPLAAEPVEDRCTENDDAPAYRSDYSSDDAPRYEV